MSVAIGEGDAVDAAPEVEPSAREPASPESSSMPSSAVIRAGLPSAEGNLVVDPTPLAQRPPSELESSKFAPGPRPPFCPPSQTVPSLMEEQERIRGRDLAQIARLHNIVQDPHRLGLRT
ncbi:unnamed protein product [Tilletia controversa]|nr:unnamed protein product [Tilletia controversa]